MAHHAPAMVPRKLGLLPGRAARRRQESGLGVCDQFGVIVADGRKMADVEAVQAASGVAHPVWRVAEEVLRSSRGIPDALLFAVPPRLVEAVLFPADPMANHEDDADTHPDDKDSGCCDDDDP